MPAAAVTPAPQAFTYIVAVKKLVVGIQGALADPGVRSCVLVGCVLPRRGLWLTSVGCSHSAPFTLRKLEGFNQAPMHLNISAWNNTTGLLSCFVGFIDSSNDQ